MPCIFVCQLMHLPLLILNQQKKFPKRCNSVSETFFVGGGRIYFFATFSRVHSLKRNEWLALCGALNGELLCRPRSSSELTTSSRSVAVFRTA